jgi:glycosyltransferase involved in cell wall biosynthesis
MELVFEDVSRFDVIHFHTDFVHFPFVRRHPCANVTTLHGMMHPHDHEAFFDKYRDVPLVSISDNQRRPISRANWRATVYHGLPSEDFTFSREPSGYLVYLGRMSPEKRVDRAIDIAVRAHMPLKIAAKIYPEEQNYFDRTLAPLIQSSPRIEFIGEVDHQARNALLGGATAMLFPIEWSEPFGLVMIEALACGTPVIGWRRGSVPEVLEHGVTGYVVDDVEEAVAAVKRIDVLSRAACRRAFERRFNALRMANDYIAVYRALPGLEVPRRTRRTQLQ